jgi:hypothetical protein
MSDEHVPLECECNHMYDDHRDGQHCLVHGCACQMYEARISFPERGEELPRPPEREREPEAES